MENEEYTRLPVYHVMRFHSETNDWRTSCYQLLSTKNLSLTLDMNGHAEHLSNALLLVPPGTELSLRESTESLQIIEFNSEYLDTYFLSNPEKRFVKMPLNLYIHQYLDFILNTLTSQNSIGEMSKISAHLFFILTELLYPEDKTLSSTTSPDSSAKSWIDGKYIIYAARYIRKNYSNKSLSLEDISKAINYHPNYFCSVFKSVMGITPMKYVNKLRLASGLHLLRTTDEPVQTICEKVGISTPSIFSSLIKHHVGVTPTEFRRKQRLVLFKAK